MAITIVPFAAEHLDPAADLLAVRHRSDRTRQPGLLLQYEEPAATRGVLHELLARDGVGGVVAMREGRFAGFLLEAPFLLAPTHRLAVWVRPRAAQIPFDGHAVDRSDGDKLYPRLYEALAARWVADGLAAHYLALPADRDAVESWFDLGFGRFIELGVRDTQPLATRDAKPAPALDVRRAVAADEETIQALMTELFRSFADSPIFMPFLPETAAERRRYVAELLADPTCPHWLAFADGRLVGLQVFVEPTSSHWNFAKLESLERCVYLQWACTVPEARSAGIGAALFARTMMWAREAGYERCAAHFMTASRAAAHWRGLGFRPISHWLCRPIDDRRTWAAGRT
jgi:GNAT superfamily N-acetyltransferase